VIDRNLRRLEVGYSARSGADARRGFREPPVTALPVEYLTLAVEDRALEVQTVARRYRKAPRPQNMLDAVRTWCEGHRPHPAPTDENPERWDCTPISQVAGSQYAVSESRSTLVISSR
jgi:hypothetical protein